MKRLIINLLGVMLPTICLSQVGNFLKMIEHKEFDKIPSLIGGVFGNDTNTADYYNIQYQYYIDADNPNRDSLLAYFYVLKYNELSRTKIETFELAQSLLTIVYQSRDVEKFNRYIELTPQYEDLNKEAKRIRNQLAYEQIQESQSIEDYRQFISLYPDAPQIEDATQWLNENLFQTYVRQGSIDSLKMFAQITNYESYRAKALTEIDRLSFAKALKGNSIDSYMTYIRKFPNGSYIKMAKNNIEKLQYEQYVTKGSITDMILYLNTHSKSDKMYEEIVSKLSLIAIEKYSLLAMQKVYEIKQDNKFLKTFAKKYASDLDLHQISMLIEYFPFMAQDEDIVQMKHNAEILEHLMNKPKLMLDDYKKNKNLFKSLNANKVAKVIERFEELNSQQPQNKALQFELDNDRSYVQFKKASAMELNFVLTENQDNVLTKHSDIRLFAQSDTNGYDWYAGNKNRDIYVCLKENGKWDDTILLSINTRYDETAPVLSADKKMLWFSSDRGLNFGKKDIYVSYREDTNDWNSWSEPILLPKEFNTPDDDYIVYSSDKITVITQDSTFNEDNYIYMEGTLNIESGKIHVYNGKEKDKISNTEIYIYDKNTLRLINIVRTNHHGYYAYIKENVPIIMHANQKQYFSALTDVNPILYDIEEMKQRREIITIASPFDSEGKMHKIGKKNLELLADCLIGTEYMIQIGVHTINYKGKVDIATLNDNQAKMIFDVLNKAGVDKDKLIVKGYGKENVAQSWEGKDCIDIYIY